MEKKKTFRQAGLYGLVDIENIRGPLQQIEGKRTRKKIHPVADFLLIEMFIDFDCASTDKIRTI